jgi:branched-chain amino acid transport system substrate-binding protein
VRRFGLNRFTYFAGAVLLLPSVILAASSSASSAAAPSGQPIDIMNIGVIQSSQFSAPEMVSGAQAAVKAINSSGGVDGRPLVLQTCNDQADPDIATSCAEKAVQNKDAAVVGTFSISGTQILPVLQSAGMADIADDPISPTEFSAPNSFPVECGTLCDGAGSLKFFKSLGVKDVAIPYEGNSAGQQDMVINNEAAKTLGMKVTGISVPPTATDLSTYESETIASSPGGVLLDVGGSQNANFIKGLRSLGSSAKIVTDANILPNSVLKTLGSDANGLYLDSTTPPTFSSIPTAVQFRKDMKKYEPAAVQDGVSLNSWVAVELFAKAASGLKTVTPKTMMSAMKSINNLNFLYLEGYTPSKGLTLSGYNRIATPLLWFEKVQGTTPTLTSATPENLKALFDGPAG